MIKQRSKILCVFASVCVTILACKKDVDNNNPVPIGARDSTLLIKSVTTILQGQSDVDSIIETYSYDSVNHEITSILYEYPDMTVSGSKAIFHYNDKDLLSKYELQYPVGYSPADNESVSLDFVYDQNDVIAQITDKYFDGTSHTTEFKKTALSAGNYQLEWLESPFFDLGDSVRQTAIFDANGNNLVHIRASDNTVYKDSLVYDAAGSLSQVISDHTVDQLTETHTSFSFLSRLTKGDQLYNQRRALLNGIANIPFTNDLTGFTILNFFPDGIDHYEYAKYPFQSVQRYNWNTGSTESFTASSVFDSKDRLIEFNGFFDDYEMLPQVYRISYYK